MSRAVVPKNTACVDLMSDTAIMATHQHDTRTGKEKERKGKERKGCVSNHTRQPGRGDGNGNRTHLFPPATSAVHAVNKRGDTSKHNTKGARARPSMVAMPPSSKTVLSSEAQACTAPLSRSRAEAKRQVGVEAKGLLPHEITQVGHNTGSTITTPAPASPPPTLPAALIRCKGGH